MSNSRLFFHLDYYCDFEEFQKTMKIMKEQPTIAHGLGTHTIERRSDVKSLDQEVNSSFIFPIGIS